MLSTSDEIRRRHSGCPWLPVLQKENGCRAEVGAKNKIKKGERSTDRQREMETDREESEGGGGTDTKWTN